MASLEVSKVSNNLLSRREILS
uniref:Uncharacterized protein n=1 Tax=Rhizophora mucronata TaxID=61149 RepID=A0A2P2R0T1_RHIMU